MVKKWRILNVWFSASLILFGLSVPFRAQAAGSCSVVSQPHSVTPGSTTAFQITVTNTGSETLDWIKITRPSANFNITAASATGWFPHRSSSTVVFDNGSLAPGAGITLSITAAAANVTAGPSNWQSQVSDDPDGVGAVSCSGDTSTSIAPTPPAPTISSISVSGITNTSATVNWSTDQPSNSVVRYGTSTGYGQNSSSGTNVTSHNIALSGLSPSTNYHFQVESTGAGGKTTSGDNVFTTAAAPSSTPAPSPVSTPATSAAPAIVSAVVQPTPNSPITITLAPLPKTIYEEPPTISGTASDPSGITIIEYSMDGGINWLGANMSGAVTSPSFSFTPANLPDGNYTVIARAINSRSEQNVSTPISFVIDKIAPAIGGVQTAIGPQYLEANAIGQLETVAGIDQKISMHVIGGSTSVVIRAYNQDNPADQHSFSLSHLAGTELWSAVTSFTKPGRYRLEATAIDGANRQTDKSLGEIIAIAPLQLTNNNQSVKDAKATLFAWEDKLNNWIVWPAEAYGQNNPQQSSDNGQIRFYLPPGRYYMQMESSVRKSVSDIVTLDRAGALTGTVKLKGSSSIKLGPLRIGIPNILPNRFKLKINESKKIVQPTDNRQITDFVLSGNDRKLAKGDISGRQTLIVYAPTWTPATSEQLAILDSLSDDAKSRIIIYTELEDPAAVQSFASIAGYDLDLWLDVTGKLTKQLETIHAPTTVLVDKNGVIKTLMSGVLSKQAIIELMGSQ